MVLYKRKKFFLIEKKFPRTPAAGVRGRKELPRRGARAGEEETSSFRSGEPEERSGSFFFSQNRANRRRFGAVRRIAGPGIHKIPLRVTP